MPLKFSVISPQMFSWIRNNVILLSSNWNSKKRAATVLVFLYMSCDCMYCSNPPQAIWTSFVRRPSLPSIWKISFLHPLCSRGNYCGPFPYVVHYFSSMPASVKVNELFHGHFWNKGALNYVRNFIFFIRNTIV